jgi:hypothetical protein
VLSLLPPVLWIFLFQFGAWLGISRAIVILAGLPLGSIGLFLWRRDRNAHPQRVILRFLSMLLNVGLIAGSLISIAIAIFVFIKYNAGHFH